MTELLGPVVDIHHSGDAVTYRKETKMIVLPDKTKWMTRESGIVTPMTKIEEDDYLGL